MTHTLEIFDPPMCCPTGLCGPEVDPTLLDIQEALLKVQTEFNGRVQVARYSLPQQATQFMRNAAVLQLLQDEGIEALPITLLDGRIVKQGAYPTWEELRCVLDDATVPTNGGK